MTTTPEELAADAAAFRVYTRAMLESMGMMGRIAESQIPENAWIMGATAVIVAANASADQTPTGRQQAGQAALRAALDSTGQGGEVTDAQVASGATSVLYADFQWRKSHPAPVPPATPAT